jgi:4-hydroxymandelate oxidase
VGFVESVPPTADPRPPLTVDDYEDLARARMEPTAFDYYAGGAGSEWTLAENRRAFDRWVLRPRVLVDVANVDLRTTVLGEPWPFPIGLAPTAFHKLAHPDGELATARAAAGLGATMVLSTVSTIRLEDVAAVGGLRWFQLYVFKDRAVTEQLVRRAEAAGYAALAVTVDVPFVGRRYRDERNAFSLPPGITLANFADLGLPDSSGSALFAFFLEQGDPTLSWRDLEWLRSLTSMRVLVKGVLTAEDARLAVEAGVDGIVVSNHGGRQLDGVPASLDALPEVVEAVEGRVEVLVDGGVRRGSDVVKALALGAKAVFVGRPYLWGLAADGQEGVAAVLSLLREELAHAMALCGSPSIEAIGRSVVAPAPGTAPASG